MKIAVVGLGRVGAVGAACLASSGHTVIGIDVDENRIEAVRNGTIDFYEPKLEQLLRAGFESGALEAKHASEIDRLHADVVILTVGTPQLPDGSVDMSQVRSSLGWIRDRTLADTLVVMKSTLSPGTGRSLSDDYGIRYAANPEFLQEGRAVDDWMKPSRIVAGIDREEDATLLRHVYERVEAPWLLTDITTAEMIKYASNAFLATKISFINEVANLCDLVAADIDDVAEGMGLDPRIGSSFLRAGIGYGGSCFPKDVQALESLSRDNGYGFELLKGVIVVNERQRRHVVDVLADRLRGIKGHTVAVLGLSFKPNTDDVRESPGIDVARRLFDAGATVRAFDPMALQHARRALPPVIETTASAQSAIENAHAAVICTEWDDFRNLNWQQLRPSMKRPYLIVDGRNALSADQMVGFGYDYVGIGRGRSAPDHGTR